MLLSRLEKDSKMTKSNHLPCHTTESRDTEHRHTTMRMNTSCHMATDYTGRKEERREKRREKKNKRE